MNLWQRTVDEFFAQGEVKLSSPEAERARARQKPVMLAAKVAYAQKTVMAYAKAALKTGLSDRRRKTLIWDIIVGRSTSNLFSHLKVELDARFILARAMQDILTVPVQLYLRRAAYWRDASQKIRKVLERYII